MPRIDFSKIDDVQDFSPIPAGTYQVKVADVEETTTQNGDPMWKMVLQVTKGEHEGRRLFDNLVFTERALSRVKLVCSSLGADVIGAVDLTPDMLLGKECQATTIVEDYLDNEGTTKRRNCVPFAGYKPLGSGSTDGSADGRVPF